MPADCGRVAFAVEVIAAGNANVGHRLAPEFGLPGREGAMHIAGNIGAGREVETRN